MSKYREIEEGRLDSPSFFAALGKYFPDATTFYAEGSSIAEDVKNFYRAHAEGGEYRAPPQTLFNRRGRFKCHFSPSFVVALTILAERPAEAELLDHLALYRETVELLSWHDAFANVLLVSKSVPASVVAAFATELGLQHNCEAGQHAVGAVGRLRCPRLKADPLPEQATATMRYAWSGGTRRMRNEFTAVVERDRRWYIAYCPEIPGANGQGRTKAAALKSLRGAITLILEDRRKDGLRGIPATATREKVVVGRSGAISFATCAT